MFCGRFGLAAENNRYDGFNHLCGADLLIHIIVNKGLSRYLKAAIKTVAIGLALSLSWNHTAWAYDSHYMYAYSDSLTLSGEPARRPTLAEYELNAIKQFGVLTSKLKLPAEAKIRLHLDYDGRIEQIVFLEGTANEVQLKELSGLIGQEPFGVVPDYVKSGGLSDIVTDFSVSELEGIPRRGNMYVSGGLGELIALRLKEVGKLVIPPPPPALPYDSSARAYDEMIGKLYSQLSVPTSTKDDDGKTGTQINELCASLKIAKPAEIDELLKQLSLKIQACPVYGIKSPSVKNLKSALKNLDEFYRQLMPKDLSENRNNLARVLKLQRMAFELALKTDGYDPYALFKLCDLLEASDMSLEASVLYKLALDCLKTIDSRRNELPQLLQQYANALTLAGKPEEASRALAEITAMKNADLAQARKKSKFKLEELLRKPNEDALRIISARLDYSSALRREGNIEAAKEELSRAAEVAEALPQRDGLVAWTNNLDQQIGALADLHLSSEEQLLVCKIVASLEAKLKGGFSYMNFGFLPNDESDLKERVVRTIIQEKEKKFGSQSEQLEWWLGLLAGHLETKHNYREAEALRKTVLEIKENQARVVTVPARIQLAIVQVKAGEIDAANRSYQAAISSLQSSMSGSSSFSPAHSALSQLIGAYVDAKNLSDADNCWRAAYKLQDKGYDQLSLKKLLDAYVAEKSYNKAFLLLDFLIDTTTQKPGHEANSVAPRRWASVLALRASMDTTLGSRCAEFRKLSENNFAEIIHLCDTREKPDKQFWKTQKAETIQERIDELRRLGLDSDAKKLEQKYDVK